MDVINETKALAVRNEAIEIFKNKKVIFRMACRKSSATGYNKFLVLTCYNTEVQFKKRKKLLGTGES